MLLEGDWVDVDDESCELLLGEVDEDEELDGVWAPAKAPAANVAMAKDKT